MSILGIAGICYEWLAHTSPEIFLLVMYGIVCLFGFSLIFWIKERQ